MKNFIMNQFFSELNNNIDFIENISLIFKVLFTIISFVLGFLSSKILANIRKRKLSKLISINKNNCEVLIPVRYGFLNYSTNTSANLKAEECYSMKTPYYYVTFTELNTIFEVQKIMKQLHINNEIILLRPNSTDVKSYNNKFCLGGMLANEYVERIFNKSMGASFHFKQNFYLGCTSEFYYMEGHEHLQPLLKINDELNGNILYWGDSKDNVNEYRYEKYYIILVKISSNDFEDNEHGTIHICFGNGAEATLVAIKCFINHTKKLYKLLSKHKNHYFIILKCSYNGEIDFSEESFEDLTVTMFGSP